MAVSRDWFSEIQAAKAGGVEYYFVGSAEGLHAVKGAKFWELDEKTYLWDLDKYLEGEHGLTNRRWLDQLYACLRFSTSNRDRRECLLPRSANYIGFG